MLPTHWYEKGTELCFIVIPWPIEIRDFLLVLPPSRAASVQLRVSERSITEANAASFARIFSSTAADLVLDRFGRICLPEDLTKAVGIEKEATLIGCTHWFEIWNSEKFEKAEPEQTKSAAEQSKLYHI